MYQADRVLLESIMTKTAGCALRAGLDRDIGQPFTEFNGMLVCVCVSDRVRIGKRSPE